MSKSAQMTQNCLTEGITEKRYVRTIFEDSHVCKYLRAWYILESRLKQMAGSSPKENKKDKKKSIISIQSLILIIGIED